MKLKYALAAGAVICSCLTACKPIEEAPPAAVVEVRPQYSEDYVYSTLTDTEKQLYDGLLDCAKNFQEGYYFPQGTSSDTIKKIFTLVYTQESRIFWLDSIFNYPGEDNYFKLNYRFSRDEAAEMIAGLELKAGSIISSLPQESSEYEKVKYFHDSIILRCDFSKEGAYSNTAYGALVDGSAQCEGYAFAMSYLCDLAGINNYVVKGTNAEGASHAWNKIFAEGSWYNVDCTWDDPILEREAPDYIRHDCLFVPDSDILGISHIQDETMFTPIPCTDNSCNYFIRENLYFNSSYDGISSLEEQIKAIAPSGGREAEIRFTDKSEYELACRSLFDNGGLKEIIERLNGSYGYKIASANKSTNQNLYIIHISLIFSSDN